MNYHRERPIFQKKNSELKDCLDQALVIAEAMLLDIRECLVHLARCRALFVPKDHRPAE